MTNEQREAIEDLKREYEQCNYTQSDLIIELDYAKEILSLIKEQQEEIERKNKIIEESIKYIDSNNYLDNEECQFQWDFNIKKCVGNGDCKDCIKQYFERKVENDNRI